MAQGDPITIISYGIRILPLIKNIKWEIPDVKYPSYADNAGALGRFARLETYFDSLTRQGLGRGYQLKPIKSITEKCLGHVTDLECARVHVILGVTLGMKSPNKIG